MQIRKCTHWEVILNVGFSCKKSNEQDTVSCDHLITQMKQEAESN